MYRSSGTNFFFEIQGTITFFLVISGLNFFSQILRAYFFEVRSRTRKRLVLNRLLKIILQGLTLVLAPLPRASRICKL